MLLPFLSITSINRGFVTIGSAAKFFLGISFLLQAVLSHSAWFRKTRSDQMRQDSNDATAALISMQFRQGPRKEN